jgi:hypothetical protein
MAGLLIRERSLRELESFRVVLAQRLHGLESRNLRHPLNFGQTPFGATKQNQNVSKPRRSRISMVCAFSPQRVCHSERLTESARSRIRSRCDAHGHDSRRSGHDRETAKTGQSVSQADCRGAICRPASPNRPHPPPPPSCHPPTPSTGQEPTKSNYSYMKNLFILHSSEGELRNSRLSAFGPLHGPERQREN